MALLGNLTGSSQYFNDRVFYNGVATQSLRFDDDSSAYLTRTPSSAGNRLKWTWSSWVKQSRITTSSATLLMAGTNSSNDGQIYYTTNILRVLNRVSSSVNTLKDTSAKYRDSSAWHHVVCIWDTAQSDADDRVRVYVNGERITSFGSNTQPSQNTTSIINNNVAHRIGVQTNGVGYLDGYLSEVNFVDGLALDPTYFGETKNGVWIPIEPNVSDYGTNGFRLQFDQTGVGTASTSTIGADTSGNTNHWTSSGIVASDCNMPDSPENNFCTLNPLILTPDTTFSNGSLFANLGAQHKTVHGTFGMTTGKWYWEARAFDGGTNKFTYGLTDTRNISNLQVSGTNYLVANTANTYANGDAVSIYAGTLYKNGSATSSYDTAVVDNDIVGIAFDADTGKVWFHREGTWINGSATASTTINLSNHDTTVTTGQTYHIAFAGETSDWLLNAGQDSSFAGTETAQGNTDAKGIGDFYYAPPLGFLALCTANLPEPTISPNAATQADDYFNTVLFTGNGATKSVTGLGFQPDWFWGKSRTNPSGAYSHSVYDSSRGVTKRLLPDLTDAESTTSGITSFDADGFTLGSNGGNNNNNATYVNWCWKANGGTTSSNSDGSITSTVQANTTSGFSIVLYTGSESNATVGHGLGGVPDMLIWKKRNGVNDWIVYHSQNTSAPATDHLHLNNTNATSDPSGSTFFQDTLPTSTVFSIGTDDDVNDAKNYVVYCFRSIEGYSKFGSYTGNGSTDGTFVYTGFRPAFCMWKRTDTTGAMWQMMDTTRDTFNVMDLYLQANSSNAEADYDFVDFLSNGFKHRHNSTHNNASGGTYIYMAFAEAPFKYANGR